MTRLFGVTVGVALTLALGAAMNAQTTGEPERFTAFAVNMGNIRQGAASSVDIEVNRWSTDAERDKLMSIFVQKGPSALLGALQDTPRVGYFRFPNSRGYDLHYARQMPTDDGGRRVVLVTDRYIGFWEARRSGRSMDYPFTLIELRLPPEGKGVGKMSIATKISYNKKDDTIELETFDTQPVRLSEVASEKKKPS